MSTVLLYGDAVKYPALRHEVPLPIADPFLVVLRGDETLVLTSSLEAAQIARILPDATLFDTDDFGMVDLTADGWSVPEAEIEVALRALRRWKVGEAVVAPDLPVEVADRLRDAGIVLTVDRRAVESRRRAKNECELAGIRRALRAAEAGMRTAEELIRGADRRDGLLHHEGRPLTAELVRARVRDACVARGATAPPSIIVSSALSGGGHDPGSGPLPSDLPITIDVWPRDEESGCWADMARTFVAGTIPDEVARLAGAVLEAHRAVCAAAAPGVTGRELYDMAAEIVEAAGQPTQRTRRPGEPLSTGFYFALGHGVGLDIHESPTLGLAGHEPLVAGDVVAVEPGVEGLEGIGGVRVEDLLLITEDGNERLTDYAYDL